LSKVWLITGTSRGLGRAFAEEALKAGHRVVATARNSEQLLDVSSKFGKNVRTVSLDVTNEAQAKYAVDAAIETFGGLDVLVNNAGYGNVSPVEDTPLADFRAQIETNLFGVIIMTKAVLPHFRERIWTHHPNIIDRRTGRPARARRIRSGEIRCRGLLRVAVQRGRTARNKSHDRRARRFSHRLCGLLNETSRRAAGVRRDGGRYSSLSAKLRWQTAGRPGKSGCSGSAYCIVIRSSAAAVARK